MSGILERTLAQATGWAICSFARLLTGARAIWRGGAPSPRQRIYFANHASHGDFVLIWSLLPRELRRSTRPVAGSDYWDGSAARRFIGRKVFRSVLIDRNPDTRSGDPVAQMAAALDEGASLIVFPEGTRNTGEDILLPLKSGLFHLASRCRHVELVPVWIENLNRVMPKGEVLPIPLLCTVSFGEPISPPAGESRDDFLGRARDALLALAPEPQGTLS